MHAAITIMDQLRHGGVIGAVIVALSVVWVAVSAVLLLSLRFGMQCSDELFESVETHVRSRKLDAARGLLASDPSILAQVLGAVLSRRDAPPDRLREVLADAVAEQYVRLNQRISWISLIVAVAPMLGLFGTVSGMIKAFAAMAAAAGAPAPGELAGSISEALITTYLGLLVAIPALVMHAVLRHRILAIVHRVGDMGERIIAALSGGLKPATAARGREARLRVSNSE